MTIPETNQDFISISNVSKTFYGNEVLHDVSLHIARGEIRGLIGENGAGKSTIMKILAGIYKKDSGSGSIKIDGEEVDFSSTKDGIDHGISFIHQEILLVPDLSVARNIFLGREIIKNGVLDIKTMNQKAQLILDEMGLSLKPTELVRGLSNAKQQMVEICKAIFFGAKLIIMDEPTSSLTSEEVEDLFAKTRELKKQGVTIVFISHKLDELMSICDNITVLRDGYLIATKPTASLTIDELIRMMVDRAIDNYYVRTDATPGEVILEVKNFSNKTLHNVSFQLRQGEVLGFAGLIGAGRSELAKAIMGIDKIASGQMLFHGKRLTTRSTEKIVKTGFALVPEDRKVEGLFLYKDIRFNMMSGIIDQVRRFFFVDHKKETQILEQYANRLSIKMAGYHQNCVSLSGGNQQKVIISKWLATNPQIIILDEPTRGIDVGSKSEIYQMIADLARSGIAIILISSEMEEILNCCTRTAVMHEGKLMTIIDADSADFTQEKIMYYAAGEDVL